MEVTLDASKHPRLDPPLEERVVGGEGFRPHMSNRTLLPAAVDRPLEIDETWICPTRARPAYKLVRGPWNDANSCAYDSVMMLGFFMEAGRARVDQLPLLELANLSHPAQVLRQIMAKGWFKRKQAEINIWRDILRSSVVEVLHPTDRKRQMGEPQELLQVLDCTFAGLRQVSFTQTKAAWCSSCEIPLVRQSESWQRRVTVSATLDIRLYSRMIEANAPPHRAVETIFGPLAKGPMEKTQNGDTVVCNSCGSLCDADIYVVLDRLPPRIVLGDGLQQAHGSKKKADSDNLSFVYHTAHGTRRRATYTWSGSCFFEDDHFWLVWLLPGTPTMLRYDSLEEKGKVRSIHSANEKAKERDPKFGVAASIWTQVSDETFEKEPTRKLKGS